MALTKHKMAIIFSILLSLVIAMPVVLIAGGMQGKINEKINKSYRNIQNTRPQSVQNEPDYLSDDELGVQFSPEISQMNMDSQTDGRKDRDRSELIRKDGKEMPADQIRSGRQSIALEQEAPVIAAFSIYRTDYKAELEEDVVTVQGKVFFEIFKKGWTQIPLVRNSVGLIDVSVNNGAAFVAMKEGKYYLVIDRPGRYNLNMEFLIKANRERENGPGGFNFEVMSAPISQFEFTLPESGVEIFVDPSIKLEVKKESQKTIAWAVMPNTQSISVRWTKALPKETITPVKLEPKIYLDTTTYASVGEGIIRCQATLNYSVLQSEIPTVRLAFPEDVSILDVKGRDLRDWKASIKEGMQYLDVYFNFGIKGDYALRLTYERKIADGSTVAEIPWLRGVGVEREKGYFGLAAATNVELAVNKIEHASLIDVKELPSTIWSSSANPILLAFKYLNHPFSIAIEVTKHEELPVLVATVDSADYITLNTDEGKSLTKAVYQVRNNVKQFMHLVLPKNATLWSAFVAGKPVKPAKDKIGDILIPLEKSQFSGENLNQFPVEIVYLDKMSKMGLLGNIRIDLPRTDIPVSSLNWAIYLPQDYAYVNFSGDVKQSGKAAHRLLRLSKIGAGQRGFKRDMRQSLNEEKYIAQSQVAASDVQGFAQELEESKMKGVLPIKIDIPQVGRMYHFSKLLIAENESPWVSVVFFTVFKKIHGLLVFLIFVAVIAAAGLFFKRELKKKIKLEE